MARQRSSNPVLERVVTRLGGPHALAALMWPGIPRQTGYDRVYQWRARGRVPTSVALGQLIRLMRAAGLPVTDDVISALGGGVASPPPTRCRQKSEAVKLDPLPVRRDAA